VDQRIIAYQQIEAEVKDLFGELQQLPGFMKYYRGTQVLYSSLSLQPTFMFIGINPGAGYWNESLRKTGKGAVMFRTWAQKKLEYSYKDYRYPLAVSTRNLFRKAGCHTHLPLAVKSNCFFFATSTEKELYQMLSHGRDLKVYQKSSDWITRIVAMVQPRIIICEGKSAFEHFLKHSECIQEWKNGVGFALLEGTPVIAYKRLLSHILHQDEVALKIRDTLENINLSYKNEYTVS
jgi:uracil-DNA glycosylase